MAWKQLDLNSIENLRGILKDKIADKQHSSTEHLRQDLIHDFLTLVNNMLRRIKAIINVRGGHNKYWNVHTLSIIRSSLK